MSRPSRHTDRRLIEAARRLIPEAGVSALSVRAVCRAAGVNLGMFHYYFRTREAFVRRVLQEIYEEFFARLSLESSGPGGSAERLRRALLVFARFARENRRLFLLLLREALAGERSTLGFARANIPRHVHVLLELVAESQKDGWMRPVPPPVALAFLAGGVSVPNAVAAILERVGAERPFGRPLKEVERLFLSDEALALRVDLVLSGLAKPGRRPTERYREEVPPPRPGRRP